MVSRCRGVGAGDTLNGHQDNVEPDMSQPIVALSVGCDGVFLMGGRTKAEKPVALLLRSGDVVAMTAPARLCFHGARLSCTLSTLLLVRDFLKVCRAAAAEKYLCRNMHLSICGVLHD